MGPVKAGLIQRVENEFGISVSEEEALQLHTAGDVHEFLVRKLNRENSILFLRALYLTRCALANALAVPRQTIASTTRLAELLPHHERVECWKRIAKCAGGRFPRLRHSARLNDRIMLSSMALASLPVIALWWALYALGWIRGIWMLLFSMPAALAFLLIESRIDKHLLQATVGWAEELPCETVRELAAELVEMNPPALRTEGEKAPSSDEIWRRISALIQQSPGCRERDIVPATALPELENVN